MMVSSVCASLLAEHRHAVWRDFDALTWVIVGLAAVAAAWVIWKAVRYTLRPGETEADHVKRSILEDPGTLQVTLSSGDAGGAAARTEAPPGDGA